VQLALLTPGVNPGTPGSITVRRLRGAVGQAVGMSANGARDTQNRFYYDGIEAMDLDSYSFKLFSFDRRHQRVQGAEQHVLVRSGRVAGGQVNLSTKSGTNTLHGTLWEFNRNDAFTALNDSNRASQASNRRGSTAINMEPTSAACHDSKLYHGKDKTFFFFNWSPAGRSRDPSAERAGSPAALRTGDFSGIAAPIVDPSTGAPFPGNVIPAGRIAPYARKFLDGFVPAPNTNEPGINYRGPRASAPINQDQYVSRIDHTLSSRDTLSGSYIYNIQADDTTPTFGSIPAATALARRTSACPSCTSSLLRWSMKSAPDSTDSSNTNSSALPTSRNTTSAT